MPIKGVVVNGHPLQDDMSVDEDADVDEVNDEDDDNEDNEDIPLSDLSSMSSTAKEDILPHQRLTINNTAALQRSLKSIALPISQLAFSEHQSITTDTPVSITDVNDDLSRELAFYKQSLDAVKKARELLRTQGVPFSRPTDFFAEMVKSDEHMGRIKDKLIGEASRKKAAVDARKQRDLRKFGKQVQVARLQERDRLKRDTLDRIQLLKRSAYLFYPTYPFPHTIRLATDRPVMMMQRGRMPQTQAMNEKMMNARMVSSTLVSRTVMTTTLYLVVLVGMTSLDEVDAEVKGEVAAWNEAIK